MLVAVVVEVVTGGGEAIANASTWDKKGRRGDRIDKRVTGQEDISEERMGAALVL